MNEDFILNKMGSIKEFINSKITPHFREFHQENINYITNYIKFYDSWKLNNSTLDNKSEKFSSTAELHRQLENNLHEHKKILSKELIFALYEKLETYLAEHIEQLQDELVLSQDTDHFNSLEKDSQVLRIQKKFKSFSFSIGKTKHKLFKEKEINGLFTDKEKGYSWKRKVPLKNLAYHYLLHNYLNTILKNAENYIELVGKGFIDILIEQKANDTLFVHTLIPFIVEPPEKSFDDTYKEYINKINSVKNNLNLEFDKFITSLTSTLDREFELFKFDHRIIGTIELPKRKFNEKRKLKELSTQKNKLQKSRNSYKNFTSAVFDRIEYYEDLLWFSCLLVSNSYNIKKYSDPFANKIIAPIINNVINEFNQSRENLGSSKTKIDLLIENEKEKLKSILDQKYIPSLLNKVTSNNVSDVLKDYSKKLEQFLNEFDKKYTFVKPKSLIYRLQQDQLKEFSPKEIISPIVIKKLTSSSVKITSEFNDKIAKLNSTIIGLGRIVEFNLDSAKVKLAEENTEPIESVNIARDGLSRAVNKTEDYFSELKSHLNDVAEKLEREVKELLDDLISLSNIDRLITIKLQVSKEKAIQEVKDNFHTNFVKIKEWFVWVKEKSINIFSVSKEKLVGISSKVGLSSTPIELSEAMADYLVRVAESLDKLPYVYQRLFSNDQLNDERIFIAREEEIGKLEKAITYWLNNQIASVMLIGEKGSGTSSLVNIALNKFDLSSKVYRKEFTGTIYTEEELLDSLKNVLKLDDIQSADQLIETLNNFAERIIVVIENIEDFFLRISDGFEAITKLLEIISATNSKVLWITTCNTYSWDFLRRVMNINDFFIFNIKLKGLNEKLVENIILSRHNISGYDLEFIPSTELEKRKTFIKLPDSEKQDFLKGEYFEQLTKLTSNNIAVALFLWLRSIVNADKEKIQVSLNIELDFSFLKSLSDQKLFALMALILHDGLTHKEHSLIFNTSLKSSQLLFATLSDDGIIFKRNGIYKINFQLYKPIISLLKDKNILH
jgi:hypothetical protein